MLVRSQATNQRPPDRTARTGDQNSHRVSLSGRLRRLASFSIFCPFLSRSRVSMETPAHRPTPSMLCLLERGGQVFVVGVDDKDREQLAGAVVLAFRLTRWMAPGVSYQLSPAR